MFFVRASLRQIQALVRRVDCVYEYDLAPPDIRDCSGTVQSDRWRGAASMLAGSKLIAVTPVLGWWNRRPELQTLAQPFSLIVTVVAEGMDIYTPIQTAISLPVEIET